MEYDCINAVSMQMTDIFCKVSYFPFAEFFFNNNNNNKNNNNMV